MGHTVAQVSDPWDLFEIYNRQVPDVIFLDIFMPDFNGIGVARWLVEKRYSGRIVFMTGYHPNFLSAARSSVEQQIYAEITTLEKPARVEQILHAIGGEYAKAAEAPATADSGEE